MEKKKVKANQEEVAEKKQEGTKKQKEESQEEQITGFPKDKDFKRFLGCGG